MGVKITVNTTMASSRGKRSYWSQNHKNTGTKKLYKTMMRELQVARTFSSLQSSESQGTLDTNSITEVIRGITPPFQLPTDEQGKSQ